MMKKAKSRQPLKFSYKQRYKNQAKSIRQLRSQLVISNSDKELLKAEVEELKQKCKVLQVDLNMCNNIKQMYFNALNTQAELQKVKKPWWKRVFAK